MTVECVTPDIVTFMYGVGIGDRIDQAGSSLQTLWRSVAAIFLIVLLVAAGTTIERAAKNRQQGLQKTVPSGFGELQKSTYSITEKSGEYNNPKALVDISSWRRVNLEKIGVEVTVPAEWEQKGGRFGPRSVVFVISAPMYTKEFSISLLSNPRDYSGQEFIWREVLAHETSVTEGFASGVIGSPTSWLIDGAEGLSLYYSEIGEGGDYIVLPRKSRMLIFYVEDLRFSPHYPELYTVLSTVKLLD